MLNIACLMNDGLVSNLVRHNASSRFSPLGLSEHMQDIQELCKFFNGGLVAGHLDSQAMIHHCQVLDDGKPCCKDKAPRDCGDA